jgi:acetate kinase
VSVLVLNAGSSSLKFGVFGSDNEKGTTGTIEGSISDAFTIVNKIRDSLLKSGALRSDKEIRVIGQRVVHGGTVFRQSVRITSEVKAQIEALTELAPLHNPAALQSIKAAEDIFPGVPQVAVFDTTFFQNLEPRQYIYPVPYDWYTQWGVRRFGFHGISHAYCAELAGQLLGKPAARLIICHLGQGCSATATRGTSAVATSMGFTPLEGLMMGSRSGSVDPGLLLFVQRQHGLTAEQLEDALNHNSGLKGVSGISADLRPIEKAAASGDPRANLALDIFVDRLRKMIGSLAVTLSGVDALVFTAGIGENSAKVRAGACQGLECLGLTIDLEKNARAKPGMDIAADRSSGRIFVVHTEEERRIAEEARRVIASSGVR